MHFRSAVLNATQPPAPLQKRPAAAAAAAPAGQKPKTTAAAAAAPPAGRSYYLMKSEAEVFSIDDLAQRKDQTEPWDGALWPLSRAQRPASPPQRVIVPTGMHRQGGTFSRAAGACLVLCHAQPPPLSL